MGARSEVTEFHVDSANSAPARAASANLNVMFPPGCFRAERHWVCGRLPTHERTLVT